MTERSQNRLKKKLERKKAKQREKRWKRINSRIDRALTVSVLLAAVVIAGIEALEAVKNNKKLQR